MSTTILIDAGRTILAATQKATKPAEWTALKNAHTGSSEVVLTALPTGYRRGRRLSDDGLECTDQPEPVAPAPTTAEVRREQVAAWAREIAPSPLRLAMEAAINRTGLSITAIMAALCYQTLAAAGNESVITDDLKWAEIRKITANSRGQLASAMTTHFAEWSAAAPFMSTLGAFYEWNQGAPRRSTTIPGTALESGKQFAGEVLFG